MKDTLGYDEVVKTPLNQTLFFLLSCISKREKEMRMTTT